MRRLTQRAGSGKLDGMAKRLKKIPKSSELQVRYPCKKCRGSGRYEHPKWTEFFKARINDDQLTVADHFGENRTTWPEQMVECNCLKGWVYAWVPETAFVIGAEQEAAEME